VKADGGAEDLELASHGCPFFMDATHGAPARLLHLDRCAQNPIADGRNAPAANARLKQGNHG
jgi:hypothetical protein